MVMLGVKKRWALSAKSSAWVNNDGRLRMEHTRGNVTVWHPALTKAEVRMLYVGLKALYRD